MFYDDFGEPDWEAMILDRQERIMAAEDGAYDDTGLPDDLKPYFPELEEAE